MLGIQRQNIGPENNFVEGIRTIAMCLIDYRNAYDFNDTFYIYLKIAAVGVDGDLD